MMFSDPEDSLIGISFVQVLEGRQEDLSVLAAGNGGWPSHGGGQLGGFSQGQAHTYRSIRQSQPFVFTQKVENVCPPQNGHADVCSSVTHDRRSSETSRASLSRGRTNKLGPSRQRTIVQG